MNKEKINMDYICPTCKTKYVSTNGEKPQGIKWSDGHKCDPRSVQSPMGPLKYNYK
jgi:DNA-directed RNA polymerase subunit RPC12/RpoP